MSKVIRVHTLVIAVVMLIIAFPVFLLGLIAPIVGEFDYMVFVVILSIDFLVLGYGIYVFVKALRGEVEWFGPFVRG